MSSNPESSAESSFVVPEFFKDEIGLKKLANYLRSADGVSIRDGIEHDKRIQYFKGNIKLHWKCILSVV